MKVRVGEKVELIVSEDNSAQNDSTKQGKGLINETVEDNYIPRRKKISSGIRFFDLGVISNISNYQSFSPEYSFLDDWPGLLLGDIEDSDKADLISAIESPIFATLLDNFPGTFLQIVKSSSMENTILISVNVAGTPVTKTLGDMDEWTSSGLILTTEQLSSLGIGSIAGIFYGGLDVNNITDTLKATLLPDIDAESVSFTPSLKMDIYLAPDIILRKDEKAQFYNGLHSFTKPDTTVISDLVKYGQEIAPVVSTFPRDKVNDLLDANSYADTDNYINNYKLLKLMASLPDAVVWEGIRDFSELSPYSYFTSWSTISSGSIPYSSLYSPTGTTPSTYVYSVVLGGGFNSLTMNRLVAIIKKDSQWFYIWRV